jgi:N,N'-diacetyllegionaminate synthase
VFKKKIYINKKIYLENSLTSNKVFVIAEAGVAHFGSIKKAKKLVDLAKIGGADAVKFQAYKTEDLISLNYPSWFKRYKSKEVNFYFYKKICNYCKKKKIIFLLTPHSISVIPWLKKLNIPIIKIGSGELENFEFIEKIINLNRPIIISTGMHDKNQMHELKNFFLLRKFYKVVFLRCITLYPTPYKNINIRSFENFKNIFSPAIVGYSDHSKSELPIISSIVLGARVIEKHISLDFKVKNAQDWKVSCDKNNFKDLVNKIRTLEILLGRQSVKLSVKEKKSRVWATRSLHSKEQIKKNDIFSKKNLTFLRPGNGKKFLYISKILGKKSKKSYFKNQKI